MVCPCYFAKKENGGSCQSGKKPQLKDGVCTDCQKLHQLKSSGMPNGGKTSEFYALSSFRQEQILGLCDKLVALHARHSENRQRRLAAEDPEAVRAEENRVVLRAKKYIIDRDNGVIKENVAKVQKFRELVASRQPELDLEPESQRSHFEGICQ